MSNPNTAVFAVFVAMLVLAFLLQSCIVEQRTRSCMGAFPEYTEAQCRWMAENRGYRH